MIITLGMWVFLFLGTLIAEFFGLALFSALPAVDVCRVGRARLCSWGTGPGLEAVRRLKHNLWRGTSTIFGYNPCAACSAMANLEDLLEGLETLEQRHSLDLKDTDVTFVSRVRTLKDETRMLILNAKVPITDKL